MVFKFFLILFFFGLLGLSNPILADNHRIALTIDDLPFVGEAKNFHLNKIIETFQNRKIPVTGFVIAGHVRPENWSVLQKFKEAGLGIGNHTFSHANVHQMSAEAYIQQIDDADKILQPLFTKPKYFRYPYLAMGEGAKKSKIQQYLTEKNYQIAPITIDSQDFIFNQLLLSVPEIKRREFFSALKPCYLDFIWQQTLKAEELNRMNRKNKAQILLIHANLLNAYVLPEIIDLYQQHGYTFISLQEALSDSASH